MPNILRIRTILTGTAVTGGGVNDLHFDFSDGTGAQDCQDAVEDFWTNLLGASASVSAIQEQEAAIIDAASGSLQGYVPVTVTGPQNAGASGTLLPRSSQGLLRFGTNAVRRGRRVRGKVFVPGMRTNEDSDGRPAAALVAAFGTTGRALIAAAPLVIYSRPGDAGAGASAAATTASGWTEYAVLRSRRD